MTIIADIKRVMRGHSDRALIHAVGQSGLEQARVARLVGQPIAQPAEGPVGTHQGTVTLFSKLSSSEML